MKFEEYLAEQKMPKDVPLKYVIKTFEQFGFDVDRETPHVIMKNSAGKTIVLPNHKQMKSTTLRKVITEAGLNRDDFLKKLEKNR